MDSKQKIEESKPPLCELVQINVGSFFKLCEWDTETDEYNLQDATNIRVFGSVSKEIIQRIIEINIDVLAPLLQFKSGNTDPRSIQIMNLIKLASEYSEEKKLEVFGYSVSDFLHENMDYLSTFLDTHFDQALDDIMKYSPETVAKYKEYGELLSKLYKEGHYNEMVQLFIKINNLAMEFSLHLLLTMINVSYILFLNPTIPSIIDLKSFNLDHMHDVTYETNIELLTTRLAYGAMQIFIINKDRCIVYQRQTIANLASKFSIPKHIQESENPDEIESYIYNAICKKSKVLKGIYPFLAIKREVKIPIERIYNTWNALDNTIKSQVGLQFGFKKGDVFDIMPYIMTLGNSQIVRIREFSRYVVTTMGQLDRNEAKEFTDVLKEFDDVFDYILFPDRKNTVAIGQKLNKELKRSTTKILNLNEFERGKYSGKYLLNEIVINKSHYIKKIFNKLIKQHKNMN